MVQGYLDRSEDYLRQHLLPFWLERAPEPVWGGFQTNYDRHGQRTAVTEKTLLCQARCLVTLAHAVRLGWDWPGWEAMLRRGTDFLEAAYRDPESDGYVWVTEANGTWKDQRKVMYGHSFLLYAYSELALTCRSTPYRQRAEEIFDLIVARAADLQHGGFFEHFSRLDP
jgi:mannobiose 2-epimerase